MKWVALTILVSIGLVAGDGAWKENQVYKYNVQGQTRNNKGGVAARVYLSIYPQSDALLIGQINGVEYGEVDRKYSKENLDLNDDAFLAQETPLHRPFHIHLQNGIIQSISVDRTMTADGINQLRDIVSQFQVDTNAQNLIPSEDNHTPNADGNNVNAFYKTMESSVTGTCETQYDISPLPNYLLQAHPKWVPLPALKKDGDFIKIEKTRNFNNCRESNDNLSFYKQIQNDGYQALVTRIVISGDLKTYTIQSSATTSRGENFFDYLEVTLESVENGVVGQMSQHENLVTVGLSSNTSEVENQVSPTTYSRNNDRQEDRKNLLLVTSAAKCPKAQNAREQWTVCSADAASPSTMCKDSFGPEWEDVDTRRCGNSNLGTMANCRRSYPGCVSSACYSLFVHHDTLCNDHFNGGYPATCGAFVDCAPGFYGVRCCPSSYQ